MSRRGAGGRFISGGDPVSQAVNKGMDKATKVLIIIGGIILAVGILALTVWLAKADFIPKLGEVATSTPINPPSAIETVMNVLLGKPDMNTNWTWEMLIIRLAIFLIILFAFADIISMFSTFSETTSYLIAMGLAIIAGTTKTIDSMAGWMGLTAGIGAIGLFIIIMGAFAAAITLNLGIGGVVRKWRMRRQMEIESMKSAEGTSRVTNAIKGLKDIDRELAASD